MLAPHRQRVLAGTGEVELAIASATFHPQAAAFTALLKMCAKDRQWEKALEVRPSPNDLAQASSIKRCLPAGVLLGMQRHRSLSRNAQPRCLSVAVLHVPSLPYLCSQTSCL